MCVLINQYDGAGWGKGEGRIFALVLLPNRKNIDNNVKPNENRHAYESGTGTGIDDNRLGTG